MSKLLVGSTKNGWEIDTEKQELVIYHLLSIYEKLNKTKQYTHIPFHDIREIYVGWNNVPMAIGENQHFVLLTAYLNNNEILNFDGTKNDISKELFKQAILLLKENKICFNDPYNILDKIINTEDSIWEILNEAEIKRRKSVKEK